ncbi:MAG TPA: oligosaccharide flippase family protein, partial [Paracoccaceae bacterium]|nr:oligosaccharide flippase family protein [Paracoccaceae bacterium]
ILLGGMAGFATLQGERLIVANQLTATDLGLFSAALTLAMAPTMVVQRIVSRMFLPVLARHQDDEDAFRQKAELSLESLLVTGLTLMLVYVLVGPILLPVVYGADFTAGAPLVAILGITYTLRMVRAAPTSISMAKGHTVNLLFANILRFTSFPVAFLIAVQGGGLVAIATTGIAGEAIALIAAYALIAIREGMAPVLARRAALYGFSSALALLLAAMSVEIVDGPAPALAAVVLWLITLTRCQRFFRYLGGEVYRFRLRRP